MLNVREILVSARGRAAHMVCLAGLGVMLSGCGQKGALYLPTAPEAKNRATLPQTIRPAPDSAAPSPAPSASEAAR